MRAGSVESTELCIAQSLHKSNEEFLIKSIETVEWSDSDNRAW